jgi:alpha-glucosidase
VPFYITWRPSANLAFGIFYDTFSDCAFDFGCERSAYHGLFRSFIADHGILDYYVIAGPSVAEVVRRFTWLTGRPALLPKWSLGYSASGMSYTGGPGRAGADVQVSGTLRTARRAVRLVSSLVRLHLGQR